MAIGPLEICDDSTSVIVAEEAAVIAEGISESAHMRVTPSRASFVPPSNFQSAVNSVKSMRWSLFYGSSGLGKTTVAKEAAFEACGKEPIVVSCSRLSLPETFFGQSIIRDSNQVWQDGILVKAIREGKPLVLDEFGLLHVDVLGAFSGLRSHTNEFVLCTGEVVTIPRDWRCVCTAITETIMSSCRQQRETLNSILEDFGKLAFDELSSSQVHSIVEQHFPRAAPTLLVEAVKRFQVFRSLEPAETLANPLGIRSILNYLTLRSAGSEDSEASENAFVGHYVVDPDAQKVMRKALGP